jgi:hypothetical protein
MVLELEAGVLVQQVKLGTMTMNLVVAVVAIAGFVATFDRVEWQMGVSVAAIVVAKKLVFLAHFSN